MQKLREFIGSADVGRGILDALEESGGAVATSAA